ncbi:MAG: TldD/PmbA family protein [Deltaproteobacteria bacterium]|nr:TldD/PmbA family protein [Deltaproteobacteria bacterium]
MKTRLDQIESRLKAAGVSRFEIYLEVSAETECEVLDGAVNLLRRGQEEAVAIRILGRGLGQVGLTQPDEAALDHGIGQAIAEAARARPEVLTDFLAPQGDQPGPDFADPRADGSLRPLLESQGLALEAFTLGIDPRIVSVRPAVVAEHHVRWALRSSAGLERTGEGTRASAAVGAVAEDQDDSRMAVEECSAASLEGLDLLHLAQRAAARALLALGARPIPAGRRPVVLSPQAAAVLFESLVEAMDGDRVARGASFLAGRLGAQVVSPQLTIVDNPHDPDLDGSTWIDGEGLGTRVQALVEAGHWTLALHDRASAARHGALAGGHALRQGRGRIQAGAHNVVVWPGSHTLDALLHDAEGGLWVDELLGAHTLNGITGEVSLGATGNLIRGGALGPAFEGVTVAGDLLGLLSGPIKVGSEPTRYSRFRGPAILLPEVRIASSG